MAGTPATAQIDYSSGGYYNVESGEVGAYSSVGVGTGGTATYNNGESGGADYSGGAYGGWGVTVGLIRGGVENAEGRTQNMYVQVPGLPGIVVYFGPNNEWQGVGVTFGPGAGGGMTQTNTRLFPKRGSSRSASCCRP